MLCAAGGSAAARARALLAEARSALVLVVPSETAFLGLVREVTKKMAEAAGFDDAVADGWPWPWTRRHQRDRARLPRGHRPRGGAALRGPRAEYLRVEVVDNGAMVDPRAVPRVDLARYVTERRTGGLGVHLMGRSWTP